MRATDIPVDEEGALGLCRLLLRAASSPAIDAATPAPTGNAVSTPSRRLTLFERFDRWIARMRQRDRERYLAQANDVFELEARIRELERRPYY
jgi:primosomal protein N''